MVAVEALDGDEDGAARARGVARAGLRAPARASDRARPRTSAASSSAPVEGFEALTGLGARGRVDGAEVAIGDPRLFGGDAATAVRTPRSSGCASGGRTAVVVARDGARDRACSGSPTSRAPEAAEAVATCAGSGSRRIVLLTGDNARDGRARRASGSAIDEVRAELLPEDKAAAVDELGAGLAMVGDGVNDAPALAAADLGIAMGSAGSDTAIEVADVAIMGDDPRKVAGLIGLARWTRAVVRQNIAFSLGTKLVAVGILAPGRCRCGARSPAMSAPA